MWQARAIVILDVQRVEINGGLVEDVDQLLEGLVDEDDGDEHRKTFLREAGYEADESAQIECHHDQKQDAHPHSDPESEWHVMQSLVPTVENEVSINPSVS